MYLFYLNTQFNVCNLLKKNNDKKKSQLFIVVFVTSGCPEGYYGKHCNMTCSCDVTQFCHPSYGCISEFIFTATLKFIFVTVNGTTKVVRLQHGHLCLPGSEDVAPILWYNHITTKKFNCQVFAFLTLCIKKRLIFSN